MAGNVTNGTNSIVTMKNNIVLLLFTLLMTSCSEEVINVDLNSSEPKIVIEGTITDQPEPSTVKITKTVDYFKPGEYPGVTGAKVTLSDDAGNSAILQETEPGLYQTNEIQGVVGRTFTMKVFAEGTEYSATSSLRRAAEIDSLSYEYKSELNGKNEDFEILCYFTDIPGEGDFFSFKVYKNHVLHDNSFELYNDRLSDGRPIEYTFYGFEDFLVNDTLTVEIRSIDKDTFNYLSGLHDVLAGSGENFIFSSAPANPISNISNGALGYFSAYTRRYKSIVIK